MSDRKDTKLIIAFHSFQQNICEEKLSWTILRLGQLHENFEMITGTYIQIFLSLYTIVYVENVYYHLVFIQV